jgi:hypothetical protein
MVRTAARADLPSDRPIAAAWRRSRLPAIPLEEATIATRIQLGPMPTMLSEIVVQMLADRDTIVVGPCASGSDPLAAAREAGAQLLVVQSEDGRGAIEQIFALPDLAILMISDDGRQGRLVSFAQQPVTLDRASMAALVSNVAGHA